MSRTVYYLAATLDGFIADEEDGIDWLTGYDGATEVDGAVDIKPVMEEFTANAGALVMGSATYEWLLANISTWPYGDLPTWVFTSRGELERAEGANVRFVSGAVADHAEEMLSAAGDAPLWVLGGGELAHSFAEAGLLDEVVVTVVPVVLGAGKPVFGKRLSKTLTLTGCTPFTNGMVELRYTVGRD